MRIVQLRSFSALAAFALCGCPGNVGAPPETPAGQQPLERTPSPAPVTQTSTASPDTDFSSKCPESDSSRPIRVILELDRDVDWKRSPEDVLESLESEWKNATRECKGVRIERPEARVLAVELPEPCGAQRVSGRLKLWLAPESGAGYASARVEGHMGALDVAAWAYVDPSPEPKTACVTAVPDPMGKPPPPATGSASQSPTAQWVASMRLQRALFGLFFPPLLLEPAKVVSPP